MKEKIKQPLVLKKAKELVKNGVTIYHASRVLGVYKSYLYYHLSPKGKESIMKRNKKWHDLHPEAIKIIAARASKKYNEKHRHRCNDCPSMVGYQSKRCRKCSYLHRS